MTLHLKICIQPQNENLTRVASTGIAARADLLLNKIPDVTDTEVWPRLSHVCIAPRQLFQVNKNRPHLNKCGKIHKFTFNGQWDIETASIVSPMQSDAKCFQVWWLYPQERIKTFFFFFFPVGYISTTYIQGLMKTSTVQSRDWKVSCCIIPLLLL